MKTIGSFRKNMKEKVMLNLQEYKQVKVMDFRVYYEDEDGRYRPSAKGITLGLDHYFELRRIILKARKYVLEELEIPEETNIEQLEITTKPSPTDAGRLILGNDRKAARLSGVNK